MLISQIEALFQNMSGKLLFFFYITLYQHAHQLYYTYFEVNCKQKVFFIKCSQRVLYVHARRVLSIHMCMTFILRETRTTVREWAC
jgi:hypothetical protein